jgi:hypothetical protein
LPREHTGGESNQESFPKTAYRGKPIPDGAAAAGGSEMPLAAARCPFSVQLTVKLMHKVHRLTDN